MAPPTDQEIARIIAIQDEEKRNLELYRLLDSRRRDYIDARTNELLGPSPFVGTPEEAQQLASEEFERDFLMPLQNVYGELPEKIFQLQRLPIVPDVTPDLAPPMDVPLVGEEPTFATAVRPQTRMEEDIAARETARIGVESSIDFAKLEEAFIQNEGMSEDQAALQRRAIQRAYEAEKSGNPTQTPDEVFERVVGQLEALGGTLEGEGELLTDEQGQRVGPADPIYQTYVRQRQAGQPLPKLSPAQLAYFDTIYKAQQEERRRELTEQITGQMERYYELPDGTETPADFYDIQRRQSTEYPDPVREFQKPVEREQAEVRAETITAGELPDLWWADPEKRPQVLANPEDYNQLGIFTTTTPYGGQVETPVGWLLRSALIVPNTLAGIVSEEVIAPAMLDEAGEEERVERRPELYRDSPVLLNIAENRGFTMEMNEAADIMDYSDAGKFAATAMGFGLDLLDPSFGMVGGAAKGTKTAAQMARARRAIYGGEAISSTLFQSGKAGFGEGLSYFLRDTNFISSPIEAVAGRTRGGPLANRLAVGDVRLAMGADLAGSLEARALAREADTAADATRAIDEAGLSNTTYNRELQRRLADTNVDVVGEFEKAIDDTDKVITAGTQGSKIADNMVNVVDDFDAVTRSLDEIGTTGRASTRGETAALDGLAENIGALAKRDAAIETLLRNVDEASFVNVGARGGTKRLFEYVKVLKEAGALPRLRRQFAFDKAMGYVVENTKGMTGLDRFRMVTPNTFATPEKAAEILTDVKNKSLIGAVGEQIAKFPDEGLPVVEKISTQETRVSSTGAKGIQRKAEPAFDFNRITDDMVEGGTAAEAKQIFVDGLTDVTQELRAYNKISNTTYDEILSNLAEGFITTRNYRQLVSGTIDLYAEGKQVALRGKDVAKLPAVEANRLLDPLEMRSFARGTLRKFYSNFIEGAGNTASRAVTPAQRQLVKNAQQTASNMDTTLRQGVSRLKGADEAAKYGVSPIEDKAQAIGVMIVGERMPTSAGGRVDMGTLRQEEIVADTMNWYMRTMFYTEKTTESLLDSLLGFKKVFENPNSFLSTRGKAELQEVIKEAAEKAARNPDKYWAIMDDVVQKFRNVIIKNPENLQPRVRPKDIVDVQAANKGRIPAEIQVGSYYWAESTRIIDNTIKELFSTDPAFNAYTFIQQGDSVGQSAMRRLGREVEADPEQIYREFVKQRAVRQVVEGRGTQLELLRLNEDFYDAALKAGADPENPKMISWKQKIDNYKANPNNLQAELDMVIENVFMKDLFLKGDDAAHGFVLRNDINTQDFGSTYESVSRVVEDLAGPQNSKFLEAVLGRDALDELQEAVKAGKSNSFARYVDSAIRSATGKKDFKRVVDGFLYGMRLINNLRYTILLSARTRFHGANIMTAPFITYSTIGQIPNGAKGLSVFTQGYFRGNKGRMKIIEAPDGRIYTYGEIADGLINAGIRSEFGFISDVATQQRIIAYANANGVKTPLRTGSVKAGQAAQDVILAEDMAWRAGVAVKALEEGRSFDEAMNLARRSMFDYNDMTAFEKALSGYAFIFYAFARQNFATLLRNMINPEGWNRMTRVLKTERGLEALFNTAYGVDMPSEQFFPDYMNARITYKKMGSRPDRDVYLNAPPIPPIDAMVMLGTAITEGGYADLLQRQLHPTFAQLLNVETFKTSNKELKPEHAALISLRLGGSRDPVEIANYFATIVGGEVIPVPSTDPDAIDGYKYPLSPEQQKNYKSFERWRLQFTGLGSLTTDYARALGVSGSVTQDLSTFERLFGFGSAAITPIKAARPAQVSQYDLRARIEAINQRLREIDQEERKER